MLSVSKHSGQVLRFRDFLYVALCPDLDVASQGTTIEEATANLKEAVELFLECVDVEEIKRRQHAEIFITRFEAAHG